MDTGSLPVSADDVSDAHARIAGSVLRTPLVPSTGLADLLGVPVGLKLESLQPTGSFKVRGATSVLSGLAPDAARRGVITASTGNHGRALAHVASRAGIPATVCVSVHVPAGKVASLDALGCEVMVGGSSQGEALEVAQRLAEERGLTLVHPFDDPLVIAGQGTIGRELLEQAPGLTRVLVPLSGGGLAAGVAVAIAAARPDVRIVGVSMARAAVMAASLTEGIPVDLPEQATLADSLQGGIGLTNATTFPILRALLDEVILLTEQEIWDGMRFAFDQHRIVLEGAGAVGIAAVLAGRIAVAPDERVVLICSGANAEEAHVEALARGASTPPS